MICAQPPPSPEHLAALSRVVREVARAGRLSPEDAQDFAQNVQVRLLERHHDILTRFSGRSSLKTYLTVVVNRLLLDWRNTVYGKWRASAMAVRLGPGGVRLERLVYRDGHTPQQAIAIICAEPGAPGIRELRRLFEQLPARHRRRMVSDDILRYTHGTDFDDPVEAEERQHETRRVRQTLAAAVRRLPAEDRQLIAARYLHDRRVQTVAASLSTDPKALYRRYERVLRSLRHELAAAGVHRESLIPGP